LKVDEVDLYSEQHEVRESVKNNLHTGRTYNSLDNIAKFFADRGMPVPTGIERAQQMKQPAAPSAPRQVADDSRPPWEGAKPQASSPGRAANPGPRLVPPPPKPAPIPIRPPASVQQQLPGAGTVASSGAQPLRPPSKVQSKPKPNKLGAGSSIVHPKYGRGTILRREGEGEDAKLTITFPGFGLKKIVEKYAGLKVEE
jgi:DNA helicase-2/ATP-dependent DNA helicase PcrA